MLDIGSRAVHMLPSAFLLSFITALNELTFDALNTWQWRSGRGLNIGVNITYVEIVQRNTILHDWEPILEELLHFKR